MGAIFGFGGAPDRALLARMGDALAHRGDPPVTHETPFGSIGVRAAHATPARAGLVTTSLHANEDAAIALAGYLLDGARGSLAALLAAYREEGPSALERLRGAFALAILDGDSLVLVRDGVGVRTFSWARHAARLLFASEPKAIVAAPGFPRRIRPAALAQYLSMSFVPGEGTMLEDVREALPGHRLFSRPASAEPTRTRWFFFEGERGEPDLPESAWIERFSAAHERAVRERLPPGEPVGVFLSGGLDSSAVTADVARLHDAEVRTYSLHFGPSYPNELAFARAVASRWNTRHEEVLLDPREFLPRLRKIIWHLDDPIGDPITVPNFELAARVARDVAWVWNGEGGDPLFGGPKNLPMLLHHWYGGIERDARFRAQRYLESYRRSYEDWSRLLRPEWAARVDEERDLEGIIAPFFDAEEPPSFLNKLSAMNLRLKGAHLILPKVERMTGAARLRTLSPLFDENLTRLAFAMPPRLKLGGGIEKLVMKHAFAERLPSEVILRPKSGMRVPVHHWFQGELRRWAREVLSPREVARAGVFEPARVAELLAYDQEHGPGRYGLRLWMIVTFELWRRIVVDGESP